MHVLKYKINNFTQHSWFRNAYKLEYEMFHNFAVYKYDLEMRNISEIYLSIYNIDITDARERYFRTIMPHVNVENIFF